VYHEEILTAVAGTNPDSVLEVALCTGGADGRYLELRRLSWGEGIGWYRQQTLRLDVTEAEGLLLALRGNRNKWGERSEEPKGKVIPFPTLTDFQGKCERKTA